MEQKRCECIGVMEMAKRLGIGRTVAYRLVNSEGFPAIHLNGDGGKIIIPVDLLEEWCMKRIGCAVDA